MKRVLVFGMTSNPGGVETFIMNILRSLDRTQFELDFLTDCENIAFSDEIKSLGCSIYSIPKRGKHPIKYTKEIKSFFYQNKDYYDVIWVNLCNLINIDTLRLAKENGIQKRIIHCHNAQYDGNFLKRIMHGWHRRSLVNYATDYWSCSDMASHWFFGAALMASEHYRVITNAVDTSHFAFDTSVRMRIRDELHLSGKKVIGHVGRFEKQKNHKLLLEIFRAYNQKHPDTVLILLGTGSLEERIQQYCKDTGLLSAVRFVGVTSDAADYYQAMDAFVFPSLYEGLSIALIEAQANGLPCIVSSGNTREAIINSNVAVVSIDSDLNTWISEIEQLVGKRVTSADNSVGNSQFNISNNVLLIQKMLQQ